MKIVQCAGCEATFDYTPARPNKKYHSDECRKASHVRSVKDSHSARTHKALDHDVEFIAVDGEGITKHDYVEVWDETERNMVMKLKKVHHYALLSVGDKSLHHDGAPLRHDEIFEFLYQQKVENPKAAFVGFFLGYDFSQWLKSLPESRGNALFHPFGIEKRQRKNPEIKQPWPVTSGHWDFDMLGMKRFKLRPHIKRSLWPQCEVAHKVPEQIAECATGKHNRHPHKWMYINDAGAFFQTSLLNAINPADWAPGTAVVTPAEMKLLTAGKANRANAKFDRDMIRYNVLENDVLSRLMCTLNAGFVADGIRLRADQWYGPGQAAQVWLRNIGAPTGEQIREAVPVWAIEAARMSYYGGWFETFVNGVIPEETYSYDINSAYPYAIAHLPCLLHGTWTHGQGDPGKLTKGHYRLINARFRGPSPRGNRDTYIGTMPHRDVNGGISRPRHTSGWHWQHEVDAARAARTVSKVEVMDWVEYKPCGCPPPLKAIEELYLGRLKVGKNSPSGKSKKLVYNSAYGKMAQSIGVPKFANSIYASLITSQCRTMILRAIATHPDKSAAVAMIATDGIVFLSPHPTLKVDKEKLGAWDYSVHHNLSILMPGLYWDDKSRQSIRAGKNLTLKSRGVSGKYLAPFIDTFDEKWLELHRLLVEDVAEGRSGFAAPEAAPKLPIVVEFGVVSPRLAVARDNWASCGQVVWDEPRVISADPHTKRRDFYTDGPLLRTSVWEWARDNKGARMERTLPYVNRFGAEELETLAGDQWELLTQDGTIGDIVRAVIPR